MPCCRGVWVAPYREAGRLVLLAIRADGDLLARFVVPPEEDLVSHADRLWQQLATADPPTDAPSRPPRFHRWRRRGLEAA